MTAGDVRAEPASPPIRIDGATRLLGIVGDPVAQVKSPGVYNPRIAAAGVNAVLVPVHVRDADFETIIGALLRLGNLDGVIVTYPFKARILPFVDELMPAARQTGAVNALRRDADGRWRGDMFDGVGLVRAVEGLGQSVRGRRVLLYGAGGAGKAIAFALADRGATDIAIVDLDAARADDLAARVSGAYPGCTVTATDAPDVGSRDLLVNATPLGLAPGDGHVAFRGALGPATTVVDIVTRDGTALLNRAAAAGCPHVGGRAMVAGQVEAVLGFFGIGRQEEGATGRPPAAPRSP